MPFPIENKLVIAVASSALFDLTESDAVFQRDRDEYRKYQRENQARVLERGVAFPFIRRFLNLNRTMVGVQPVEVVLLSKNDPDTGLRVFKSIQHYGLDISRAAFTGGKSPFSYIPAFNVSLFLSADQCDVKEAINAGYAAGTVLKTVFNDDENDNELRIAFDFDGVIADDKAETVYQQTGDIDKFHDSESEKAAIPHDSGPLTGLFKKLAFLQKLEIKYEAEHRNYKRMLRTAIVTARNAPSHERVVTTLRSWDVTVDETFFLGGIQKSRILEVFQPHIYFDDQRLHLDPSSGIIPSVHIPFGVTNRK
jgi:5'-nucleotidase